MGGVKNTGASSRASGCCEPRTARGPGINIMKRVFGSFLSFGLVAVALAAPAQNETNIDPRAERILRAACDYLAATPQFSITAEIWRDHVYDSGQKVQFARAADLQVKRLTGFMQSSILRIRSEPSGTMGRF
jgi:hypothetical protein